MVNYCHCKEHAIPTEHGLLETRAAEFPHRFELFPDLISHIHNDSCRAILQHKQQLHQTQQLHQAQQQDCEPPKAELVCVLSDTQSREPACHLVGYESEHQRMMVQVYDHILSAEGDE